MRIGFVFSAWILALLGVDLWSSFGTLRMGSDDLSAGRFLDVAEVSGGVEVASPDRGRSKVVEGEFS